MLCVSLSPSHPQRETRRRSWAPSPRRLTRRKFMVGHRLSLLRGNAGRKDAPRKDSATPLLNPTVQHKDAPRKHFHPRRSLKRGLELFWKRISSPHRPRNSRRFSFVPPGFDIIAGPATWRGVRRLSRF